MTQPHHQPANAPHRLRSRTKPERVVGDDRDVAIVVTAAREFIPVARRGEWVQSVARLSLMRADLLRGMAAAGSRPQDPRATPYGEEAPAGWWWTYVIGVGAAFAGAAVMLPPKGPGDQDPVLMTAVAGVALVAGAALLLIVALRPLPDSVRGSREAIALAVIPVPFLVCAGVLNLIRFEALRDAVGLPAVLLVTVAGAVCIGMCVALAVRLRGPAPVGGGRSARAPHPDGPAQFARNLARELPYSRALREAWTQALGDLAIPFDGAVAQQAREFGPFAYVVWAYYDGERALPRAETLLSS